MPTTGPDDHPDAPARVPALQEQGSELVDLVAPLWSAEKARAALGYSRTDMADRRKTGSILALQTTDGDFFYPVAQFEKSDDGRVRVKPGLRTFLMTLREHDPWTVAVILHTPAPELGDLTPLDWIGHQRDSQSLDAYASTLHAEWSR